MHFLTRQFEVQKRPIKIWSVVVSARMKIIACKTGNRDGPLIFHLRDGPPNVNGPPGGTGPPESYACGTGPPKSTGPPMEWLGAKKMLKRFKFIKFKNVLEKRENKNINNLTEIKEVYIMKTSKRNKLLCLALAGSCGLFGATSALADAGVSILNRATLSYDVGAVAQTVIESGTGAGNSTPGVGSGSDTSFVEDRLINFTVADFGGTGTAVPGTALQATAFRITNTSNTTLDFLLRGLNNADGTADPQGGTADEFDVSAIQTFVEDGTNAGFQPAEDTAVFVGSLAEAAFVDVYVVATTPLNDTGGNPLVNTNVAVMTLVAQAAIAGGTGNGAGAIMRDDNGNVSPGDGGANAFSNGGATLTTVGAVNALDAPGAMDTVFNDPAGSQNGAGAAGATQNGQVAADNSYTIQSAELTVTKASVALWDPINLDSFPKSIPTAYVRYTITIANLAGAANADLTILSDALAASLDLDPDFTDGTAANNPTSIAGNAIQITHVNNAVTSFCTGDVADADADGCSYTGGVGGTVSANIFAVMGAANAQLAGGESLTITFNAIVQ